MYERWRDQGAREKGEKIAGGKLFEMPKSNKIYEVTVPEHQINVGAYKSDQISALLPRVLALQFIYVVFILGVNISTAIQRINNIYHSTTASSLTSFRYAIPVLGTCIVINLAPVASSTAT